MSRGGVDTRYTGEEPWHVGHLCGAGGRVDVAGRCTGVGAFRVHDSPLFVGKTEIVSGQARSPGVVVLRGQLTSWRCPGELVVRDPLASR